MRWPWRRSERLHRSGLPEAPAAGPSGGHAAGHGHDEFRLVKVAYARNIAEAELIQGLLRQEGIPSMLQRNRGFDVPDFLAAGPRDVLVPASQEQRARELLA